MTLLRNNFTAMTPTDDIFELQKQIAALTLENSQLRSKNEHLQTQLNLLENESEGLLSIVEQSLFGITISQNGKFVFINDAFRQICGFETEQILALDNFSYLDYVHPEDREKSRKQIISREEGSDRMVYNFKFRLLNKSGQYRQLESWSKQIMYKGTKASLSVILDISEKESALAELETSREKYKTIFENSPIGIYYSDIHGEMGEVNDTTVKILGSPSKEATKQINLFTFPLLVKVGFSAHLRQCIDTQKAIIADTDYVTNWGKRVWIRYYLNPIFKNGVIDGALINFIDITEAKTAEMALRENEVELLAAKQHAEESVRLKTSFLENMNHEIRTPLNGILGFLDLLDEADTSETERIEYKKIITDCSTQLLSVMTDILEASSLSSGKMTLHNKSFSPAKFIDHLAFYFEQIRQQKFAKSNNNVQIITHCKLSNTMLEIVADQDKVQQIMINLLNNAFKFTHQGSIEFGCIEQNNATLLFYVKDSGIGIAPEKHQIIFERFRQADESLSRNYGGTGLGLAICKSLVELMGGEIGLQSALGEGSYFWFTIPYTVSIDNSNNLYDTQQNLQTLSGKILLVDDIEIMGHYCDRLLKNSNLTIQYVSSGSEALEACKQQTFNLILLDLQMPELDGYETLEQLRKQNIHTPAIAITANARSSTREKASKAGFAQFLSKPFKLQDFLQVIEPFLTHA